MPQSRITLITLVAIFLVDACFYSGSVHAQGRQDEVRGVCALDCSELRGGMRQASIAFGTTTTRYRLDGAVLRLDKESLQLIVTDGIRLAVAQVRIASTGPRVLSPRSILISNHGFNLIKEFLEGKSGSCTLSFSKSDLMLTCDELVVRFPAANGRFPDWKKLLQPERTSNVNVKRDALVAALIRSAPRADSPDQWVGFRFSKGHLFLSATNEERGVVKVPLTFEGELPTIYLDARYVIDFLRVLNNKEDVVSIAIQNATSPVLFSADGFRYVLMPLADD